MKIVYSTDTICNLGGIENITLVKANALGEIMENKVFIIVAENKEETFWKNQLSDKVTLINLEIDYSKDDWKGKYQVLKSITLKRIRHYWRLKKSLKDIRPDIVISTGLSEKYLVPFIPGKFKRIREYHFSKDYRKIISRSQSRFNKLLLKLGDLIENGLTLKKIDAICVLTQEDKIKNWGNRKDIHVIPNPVSLTPHKAPSLVNKKIIAVGRYVEQKNFSFLINAFKRVTEKHSDWILEIFGEGHLRWQLQRQIENLDLVSKVFLRGTTKEIEKELCSSSIFTLSSNFEGMPLVMLEAMACGLPIVSTDCPCGPKDLIEDGKNGFLVPIDDDIRYAEKLCYLIENFEERERMGRLSKEKAKDFSLDKIITKWMNLFRYLIIE